MSAARIFIGAESRTTAPAGTTTASAATVAFTRLPGFFGGFFSLSRRLGAAGPNLCQRSLGVSKCDWGNFHHRLKRRNLRRTDDERRDPV